MRHSLALYQEGQSHSTLWIVPGAEHTSAMSMNPPEFERGLFNGSISMRSWVHTNFSPSKVRVHKTDERDGRPIALTLACIENYMQSHILDVAAILAAG
jgi:hypothetical protein